jgi:SsrA-binding protein
LHQNEIDRLFTKAAIKGRAIVALKMYWKNNKVKLLIGLGIGKKQHDKRADIKKAEADREIARRFRRVA